MLCNFFLLLSVMHVPFSWLLQASFLKWVKNFLATSFSLEMTFQKKGQFLVLSGPIALDKRGKPLFCGLLHSRRAEYILFEVFGIFTFEMSPDIHTSSTTSCVAQWSAAYNCINNFRFRSVCSLCMCVRGTHQRSPIPMLFSSQSEATELGDRIASGFF